MMSAPSVVPLVVRRVYGGSAMDEEKIIGRITRALGEGEVVDGLARRLPPSDLQSLMLHICRKRSARRSTADLLAHYERSAMVRPSTADPRFLVQLERMA